MLLPRVAVEKLLAELCGGEAGAEAARDDEISARGMSAKKAKEKGFDVVEADEEEPSGDLEGATTPSNQVRQLLAKLEETVLTKYEGERKLFNPAPRGSSLVFPALLNAPFGDLDYCDATTLFATSGAAWTSNSSPTLHFEREFEQVRRWGVSDPRGLDER